MDSKTNENVAQMCRKTIRIHTKLVLTVCLATLFAGASARPARADAIKCNLFGSVTTVSGGAGGISVSKDIRPNLMCFSVDGDGNHIHKMEARFQLNAIPLGPIFAQIGPISNWRIDWVIYYKGKVWWRDNGPTQGSSWVTGSRIRGAGSAPYHSEFCAELYYDPKNQKISDACVDITP